MADDIARLVAVMEANMKGFTKGMDQAAKLADRRFGQIERRMSQTEKRFAGAFRGLGRLVIGGGALLGIQRFVSHIAEAAGKLQDTSDALGIGTDALQTWGILAGRAGIGQDQLNKSLGAFSARLGEAQLKGGDFAKFLNGIGVGTQGTAEDVFNRLADAVKNTASQQQRAAIVAEAFGAKAVKLTPIIQQGSAALRAQGLEFAKNGQIMTRESIAKIDELGDKWEDLKRQMTAVGGNVLAGFADEFSKFAGDLSSPAFQASLNNFGKVLADVLGLLTKITPLLPALTGAFLGSRFGPVGAAVGGAVGGGLGLLAGVEPQKIKELEAELQRLKSTLDSIPAEGLPLTLLSIQKIEEQIAVLRKARDEAARAAGIPLAGKSAPAAGGGIDRTGSISSGGSGGKTVAERERAIYLDTVDALETLIKKRQEADADFRQRQGEAAQEERNKSGVNALGMSQQDLEDLDDFHARAAAAWDAYYERIAESAETASEKRLRIADDFFGTLAQLAHSSSEELKAIGKAAAIIQATIDGVLAVQKALAAYPPPFNFAVAAAVGAVAAANVAEIAGMEKGGRVQAGTPYIVGEKRPELFVPDTAGRIIPRLPNIANPAQGSRTLSMSFTNQNSFAGAVDANSIRAYADQVGEVSARSAIKTIQRQFPNLIVKAQRDRL